METVSISDRVQQILLEYLGNASRNQQGRYRCYVVYRGRVTGVFDNWCAHFRFY